MDARRESERTPMKNRTTVERKSERELVVTRTFSGPARIVFEAFTKPELLKRWWAPKSFGVSLLSCEADVRTGGTYRFVFSHPASEEPMAFFGRYIEVTPHARIVWTNEESADGAVESFLRGIEVVHDDQGLGTSFFEGHRGDGPTVTTFVIGPGEAGVRCHVDVRSEERHGLR